MLGVGIKRTPVKSVKRLLFSEIDYLTCSAETSDLKSMFFYLDKESFASFHTFPVHYLSSENLIFTHVGAAGSTNSYTP